MRGTSKLNWLRPWVVEIPLPGHNPSASICSLEATFLFTNAGFKSVPILQGCCDTMLGILHKDAYKSKTSIMLIVLVFENMLHIMLVIVTNQQHDHKEVTPCDQ